MRAAGDLKLLPEKIAPPQVLPRTERTFEAIVFDWDGTAVPGRSADASVVRDQVEQLCAGGVDVFVVSGTHVGNIDGQLKARPLGPGNLRFCLNRGSEVFDVDGDGPRITWRRSAALWEEGALDRAAEMTVARLAAVGIRSEIVSQRLNRRKIDLIPEAAWADPPKARIGELLIAVTARLRACGLSGLADVVELARSAAHDAGLPDPRVTSDVKHVEIGLTDKSDSAEWALTDLRSRGIGPGLVLIVGDEFGPVGGAPGSDSLMLVPEGARAIAMSVGVEPEGVPDGVQHIGGGPSSFAELLDQQIARRRDSRVPAIDEDPAWTIVVEGDDRKMRRVRETLLTIGDGRFGIRGAKEEDGEGTDPLMVAAGIYDMEDGTERLLPAPLWTGLVLSGRQRTKERRILDLHTGLLVRESPAGRFRSMRFASLAQPGTIALRAEGDAGSLRMGPQLILPTGRGNEHGSSGDVRWARTWSAFGGGIIAAARGRQGVIGGRRTMERLAVYEADANRVPALVPAIAKLRNVGVIGFDRLLAEQRAAWAQRWRDAEVSIHGDPDAELAVRFALFHLLASVPDVDEAAVGARGLSGSAYAGHVFWDSDVFVLPALAAVHPAGARAMLEYRVRRLESARRAASDRRLAGARFPWESAHDGSDVTPRFVRMPDGTVIPIRTGEHEEHIVADVAWAACHYADWTGDEAFLSGSGRSLLTETARYWASRVRFDCWGGAHIYGVIGPDEYHEIVDDNAFTNVMARWNLRRAIALVERDGIGASRDEVNDWVHIADALVDGYDEATGLYEQFSGFMGLEPLIITETASPPVAADVLLGRDRVTRAQVIKQADVLMLHHLLPEEVAPGSLEPNVAFYGPRTAHGSSLSPAVHAALLARAGQPDRALDLFRIACRLDLDDLTGTSAGGLHMANLGGVWQALVYGFAGVRPLDWFLSIDPHLPATWSGIDLRIRFRGCRVGLHVENERFTIESDAPIRIKLPDGGSAEVGGGKHGFALIGKGWKEETR